MGGEMQGDMDAYRAKFKDDFYTGAIIHTSTPR